MLVEEESPGTADPKPLTCQGSSRADGTSNGKRRRQRKRLRLQLQQAGKEMAHMTESYMWTGCVILKLTSLEMAA